MVTLKSGAGGKFGFHLRVVCLEAPRRFSKNPNNPFLRLLLLLLLLQVSPSMQFDLCTLVRDNQPADLVEHLRRNPSLDVNRPLQSYRHDYTPLHLACWLGHVEVIEVLLGHPGIDVNKVNESGSTGLVLACFFGNSDVVRVLLRDYRVDVNLPDNAGLSPLMHAVFNSGETIMVLLASGRHVDLGLRGGHPGGHTAIDRALHLEATSGNGGTAISNLLRLFAADPVGIRLAIREGRPEAETAVTVERQRRAAELLAIVVYLCDGYLNLTGEGQSKVVQADTAAKSASLQTLLEEAVQQMRDLEAGKESATVTGQEGVKVKRREEGARRFLRIAALLPLELQMTLCQRVEGSAETLVASQLVDRALRSIACLISAS